MAAIDEMMAVAPAARVPRAHAGSERLLAAVRDEHHFAFEHIDELVLERMPVAQCRLAAGSQRDEVHAETREAARIAQAPLDALTHARAERFGIA